MTEETRAKFGERLDWLLVPAMIGLLLWPALWNGFPLIFPDTGGYLLRPLEGTLALGRSAVYGTFLAAGLPLDFWPNVLIQAAGTVFVIRVLLRAHGLGARPALAFMLVAALAAFTALPWYVSLLMPGIWAGWAVFALYLLAFQRDALGRSERLTLGAMIVFAIASHMATLALCLGLTVCFALIRFAGPCIGMPRPRLGAAATALAAGALLCPTANYLIASEFAFTPGGTTFVFGRLVQDGLIERYLDEHCPDKQVRLCRYEAALPDTADEWLWTHASPIHKLGGWEAYTPESERLILATLRLYPGQHLSTAVKAAIAQFLSFRTTLSVNPDDNFHVIATFERILSPEANARFLAARQQRDQPDVSALNLVHVPMAAISLALLAFIVAFGQRFDPFTRALCATVLLALLGNATICGVLSNPNDRYQGRMVWLAVLVTGIALASWRKRNTAAPEPVALGMADRKSGPLHEARSPRARHRIQPTGVQLPSGLRQAVPRALSGRPSI